MGLESPQLRPNVALTCNSHQDMHTNYKNLSIFPQTPKPLSNVLRHWDVISLMFYGYIIILIHQQLGTSNFITEHHQTKPWKKVGRRKALTIGSESSMLSVQETPYKYMMRPHLRSCLVFLSIKYLSIRIWHHTKNVSLEKYARKAWGPIGTQIVPFWERCLTSLGLGFSSTKMKLRMGATSTLFLLKT